MAISIELAYKWLNSDTYWTVEAFDPCDTTPWESVPAKSHLVPPILDYPVELKEKYPLRDQAGQPRRSRLHDPLQPDLSVQTIVEQLVGQLGVERQNRDWDQCRARIDQIEAVCVRLRKGNPQTDELQLAEARLEFGLAYLAMGEQALALDQFHAAAKAFHGTDGHAEAIARWMAGTLELRTPKTLLNDGLEHWQTAWEVFAEFAAQGNRRAKDDIEWYRARADLMAKGLREAVARSGLSATAATAPAAPPAPIVIPSASAPQPPASPRPPLTLPASTRPPVAVGDLFWWSAATEALTVVQVVAGSSPGVIIERFNGEPFHASGQISAGKQHWFAQADWDSMIANGELARLPRPKPAATASPPPATRPAPKPSPMQWLLELPIMESALVAGEAGLVMDTIIATGQVKPDEGEVTIKETRYAFYRLDGRRAPMKLPIDRFYQAGVVEGNSMNEIVQPGEYVVLELADVASDGQIVAVAVEDSGAPPEDSIATLKEYRLLPDPTTIELRPRNSDSSYPVKTYLREQIRVRGNVVGLLKPLPAQPW